MFSRGVMGTSARRFDEQRAEPFRSTVRRDGPQEFDLSRNDCEARRASYAIYSLFLFLADLFPDVSFCQRSGRWPLNIRKKPDLVQLGDPAAPRMRHMSGLRVK
jgi:hypothetical protein